MQKNKLQNKVFIYVFTAALICCGILFMMGRYRAADIRNNRTIVIGTIFKESGHKNGVRYSVCYYYLNKKYNSSFSVVGDRFDKEDLIFLEISSKNPDHCKSLYDIKIPSCITTEAMPSSGWKEIPSCNQ